jgi:hypothetical protein
VPKQVKKIEYEERVYYETVPVEKKVTDYYAVEVSRTYVPQYT